MNNPNDDFMEHTRDYGRFPVLLTMPDGRMRVLDDCHAERYEDERRVILYAANENDVCYAHDGDPRPWFVDPKRLHLIGLSCPPASATPLKPGGYAVMRLTDGQSFPIRQVPVPDLDGPTVCVMIPGHGSRIIPVQSIVCIDLPDEDAA